MKRKNPLSLSLSLSPSHLRPKIILLGIFLLCTYIGALAGSYIKHQTGIADAASTNITVTNNNQISTIDQGTPAITRTSTLTIKDTAATSGYRLQARIENNSIPSSTVAISSISSIICTPASPCLLTATPQDILSTTSSSAVAVDGETTEWTINITLPGSTSLGSYLLDIEYSEIPAAPMGLVENGTMQDATMAECAALPLGTTLHLRDTRDAKIYRVKK